MCGSVRWYKVTNHKYFTEQQKWGHAQLLIGISERATSLTISPDPEKYIKKSNLKAAKPASVAVAADKAKVTFGAIEVQTFRVSKPMRRSPAMVVRRSARVPPTGSDPVPSTGNRVLVPMSQVTPQKIDAHRNFARGGNIQHQIHQLEHGSAAPASSTMPNSRSTVLARPAVDSLGDEDGSYEERKDERKPRKPTRDTPFGGPPDDSGSDGDDDERLAAKKGDDAGEDDEGEDDGGENAADKASLKKEHHTKSHKKSNKKAKKAGKKGKKSKLNQADPVKQKPASPADVATSPAPTTVPVARTQQPGAPGL